VVINLKTYQEVIMKKEYEKPELVIYEDLADATALTMSKPIAPE
jgi:hypothetical protein